MFARKEDLTVHFIVADMYYSKNKIELEKLMIKYMEKYRIKYVVMTLIYMRKHGLITKKTRDDYCKGIMNRYQESVNDDLESFLGEIRLDPQARFAETYFLPQLSEEEMDLIQKEEPDYLKTFTYWDPDIQSLSNSAILPIELTETSVNEAEMKISESDCTFCFSTCRRVTSIWYIN